MDDAVLMEKIASPHRCVARIESKRDALSLIERDLDVQDVVALNIQRAVQLCVDIASSVLAELDAPSPASMAESFILLRDAGVLSAATAERMRKAVGLRNLLVHEYANLDWSVIQAVCEQHLGEFRDFVREILAWRQG